MKEIMVINPRKNRSRRATKKTGARKMAKRRTTKKRRTTAAKKRTYRRKNPSRGKTSRRRSPARAAGRRLLSGLSIKTAFRDQIPIQFGMLAAKFVEKKLCGPVANDLDPTTWNMVSYAKGAAGALAGGMIANLIKPGTGQKAFTGGLSLVINRLIRNELIQTSPWAQTHFGEDEDSGIWIDESGTPYAESNGQLLPVGEDYRMNGSLVKPTALGLLERANTALGDNDFAAYATATGSR
jgi:hypothetical protein